MALSRAQRVARNRTAHQSTPAQQAANRVAHGYAAQLPKPSGPRTINTQPVSTRPVPAGARHVPKPAPPSNTHPVKIPNPAVDPDFMYQHADLVNQQNQFRTGQQHAAQQYTANNNLAYGAIGYDTAKHRFDPLNTTPGTYGAAKRDVLDDFASRGMAYSSPYATAAANMDNDYKHRLNTLSTGAQQFAQTQADQAAINRANIVSADAANRRKAITRIAGKYGIQFGQVPAHGGTVNVRNP